MTNKLQIDRELAEQWLVDLEGCTAFAVAGQLRALLAAEPVPPLIQTLHANGDRIAMQATIAQQAQRIADLEAAPVVERQETVPKHKFDTLVQHCKRLDAEIAQARAHVNEITLYQQNAVWFWQHDGEDYLKSLSCPIIIQPHHLRELLEGKAQHNPIAERPAPFQDRVKPWMLECFGPAIAADRQERNHRFLEEALELVQASGCTAVEAHQLVEYVYGRPVGDPVQEVGGVMVTLAALCLAHGMDMHAAGETELARIWTKVDQIRAKQAAKPAMSPLPGAYPDREQPAPVAVDEKQALQDRHEAWMAGVENGKASVAVVPLLAKGFTTLESIGGKYKIVTGFENRDDAWAAYDELCRATIGIDKVKELNK